VGFGDERLLQKSSCMPAANRKSIQSLSQKQDLLPSTRITTVITAATAKQQNN
jgi:hypothetical protein